MTAATSQSSSAPAGAARPGRYRRDALLLALAGWLLRMGIVVVYGSEVPPAADGTFYHVVAQRIADGAGYTWAWPDGVVTFAAHYPVGYAGLLGGVYAIAGASPVAAMVANAGLGAIAVAATHRLALRGTGRLGASVAAAFVAFSPTLVGYTLALMTEGAVATGWIVATWLAVRAAESASAGRRRGAHLLAAGGVLGATILVRPQSLLLAPLLGFVAARGAASRARRLGVVLALVAVSLSVCVPWTLRNCERMDRCVFVSANGGWNLLIGTFAEGQGAWVPIDGARVPEACREVFAEALKDACFGRAARQRIREQPVEWAGLAPAKWRSTFDFTASASSYLGEAGAPGDGESRATLTALEVGARRTLVALALLGAWRAGRGVERHGGARDRRVGGVRSVVAAGGLVCLLGATAWVSHIALVVLAASARHLDRRPGLLVAGGAVAATLLVHGVFFGAGRYSMVLEPLLACVAGAAFAGGRWGSRGMAGPDPGDQAVFDTPRQAG